MKNFRKVLSLFMVCAILGALFGCSGKSNSSGYTRANRERTKAPTVDVTMSFPTFRTTEEPTTRRPPRTTEAATTTREAATTTREAATTKAPTTTEAQTTTEAPATTEPARKNQITGAKYVMIYNPFFFTQKDPAVSRQNMRNTGSIGTQIILGNRADGLDDYEYPELITPDDLGTGLDDLEINEGGRAGGIPAVYHKGEVHAFYAYTDEKMTSRALRNFTCIYEGEHCYIWDLDGTVTAAQAQSFGQAFDGQIYDRDTKAFGQGRFTEDGGKVHILFQPLRTNLLGFFCNYDLYATGEVSESQIRQYGINLDHAIINITSYKLAERFNKLLGTLAHEYQHLIVGTDRLDYHKDYMCSWLNEAMSAYAEELNFPGVKDEGMYQLAMYKSYPFCKGQSLYNFSTEGDPSIGAYGAVYLFSKYLTALSGDQVFSEVHKNYRNAKTRSVSEAELIYLSVSEKVRDQINRKYTYPKFIAESFDSETDLWMSKLTLDFFLSTNTMQLAGSKQYGYTAQDIWDKSHSFLIYSEYSAQDIEGGGRMVVALENDTFTIPEDAQEGLIFIGLDEKFRPVTGLFTAAGEN